MSKTSSGTDSSLAPNERVPGRETGDRHHTDAHLPFWESGCGHYGNTLGQFSRTVIDDCKDLVLSFVDTIPGQKSSVFTIADYGTSDGYASMHLIECIIRQVKDTRGDTFPVQVVYEDQEKNDFNSLFNRLSEKTSYLSKLPHVYPMATNIGFYKQCVPDGTCDFMFTSMTTHWLESLDVHIKNCVFPTSLREEDADMIHQVHQASQRDWTSFLMHRARELKPGGLLVVLTLCTLNDYRNGSVEQTPLCGQNNGGHPAIRQETAAFDVKRDLETAWRGLRDDGRITQEEFERCMSPFDIRTVKEIMQPFETVASPVQDAGLAVVHHDQVFYPFFAKELWRKRKSEDGIDDRKFFAKVMTSSHRTWSDTTFRGSLSHTRSAEEKQAILDDLYTRFENTLLTVDPEEYDTDYIISRLVVRKLGEE